MLDGDSRNLGQLTSRALLLVVNYAVLQLQGSMLQDAMLKIKVLFVYLMN